MIRLTPAQKIALEKLRDEGERGAYPGISLGTLNSLSLKGACKGNIWPWINCHAPHINQVAHHR